MRSLSLLALSLLIPLLLNGCGGENDDNSVLDGFRTVPIAVCDLSMDESLLVPLVVTLDGSRSSSPTGQIVTYLWELGDGESSPLRTVTHTYRQSSSYVATLTVTNSEGISDSCSETFQTFGTPFEGMTLQGTISIPTNTRVDSDINDPFAPQPVPNNDMATAQSLPNPAIVGGYASASGTNNEGDVFSSTADTKDFYSISLTQGQQISLTSYDQEADSANRPNFDLYLYHDDLESPLADQSVNAVGQESISIAVTGDYFIEVRAAAGFGNYILNVNTGTTSATDHNLPDLADFVPGEIIIKYTDTSTGTGTGTGTETATQKTSQQNAFEKTAADLGLLKKAGGHNHALYSLGDEINRTQVLSKLGVLNNASTAGTSTSSTTSITNSTHSLKQQTLQAINQLKARQDIEWAEPNYIYRPALTPNDAFYSSQWHYPLINLPQAWEFSRGNTNVTIAVVDTGVVLLHPDLAGNLLADGYDFISDVDNANDNDGIDSNPDDPGDADTINGSSFHGTHIAGSIAAASNNFNGVAGVTWESKVLPIRVLGIDGATNYDLNQGLRYAAGLTNDSGTAPAKKADIINLSLGAYEFSDLLAETISLLIEDNIIVVAAAGNEATNRPFYPASYPGVFSVGAVDSQKNLAPYSNTGSNIDLVAPGGDLSQDKNSDGYGDGILSTSARELDGQFTPDYAIYQGTSMASPHVAGVIALMKSVHPDLSNDQLRNLLALGKITQDLTTDGEAIRNDNYGFGLIDALKAVSEAKLLKDGIPLASVILPSPAALNFDLNTDALTLNINQFGGSEAHLSFITPEQPWLSVTVQPHTEADGLSAADLSLLVQVNRELLADGVHIASITIQSDQSEDMVIPVTLAVGQTITQSDAGRHYVLILDEERNTMLTLAVDSSSGAYTFQSPLLDEGAYYVIAGSDLDNDGFICDPGEACGGYPVLSQMKKIDLAASTSQLNFATGFDPELNIQGAHYAEHQSKGFSRTPIQSMGLE